MIVVVGSPIGIPIAGTVAAGGIGASVAIAAAALGASVQIVGRVGEDAAGDEVLLSVAAAGVRHVAVLREATHSTPTATPVPGSPAVPDGPNPSAALLASDDDGDPSEPAGLSMDAGDLDLALRYLPDYRVIVLAADLEPAALTTLVNAASWSGAHLIALTAPSAGGTGLPDDATVLERPSRDPEGTFARTIAAFAVALDRGDDPVDAFRRVSTGAGWAAVRD